jgi:predicted RNA binding protein YcfA (HicA-like mRNA interferase family)
MRLPRDISGKQLVSVLRRVRYEQTRQNGSHARLTHAGPPQHHVTVPMHDALRLGTLAAILAAVAEAQNMTVEKLALLLFS